MSEHRDTARILVVSPDPLLCGQLANLIDAHELGPTYIASNGTQALKTVAVLGTAPLVVLLDLRLPGQDGFHVLTELSCRSHLGIVALASDGETEHRHLALSLGADGCLAKPADAAELRLTLAAVARRVCISDPGHRHRNFWRYSRRDWELIAPDGSVLALTPLEARIVDVLYRHRGSAVPRQRIGAELAPQFAPTTNSLEAAISRLRRKIRELDHRSELIKAVSGVGYRLHPDVV